MFEGKYSAAQTLLDDLILNGVTASGTPYKLQANFAQNFNPNPAAKNTSESVFAVQIAVNDGSANANVGGKGYGDNLNFPYGGGPGACCGFDNPSQDVADAFKTDANGLPLPLATFNVANHVSDQTASAWTGNVDPRIDITMGRLEYLIWTGAPNQEMYGFVAQVMMDISPPKRTSMLKVFRELYLMRQPFGPVLKPMPLTLT